MEHGAKDGVVLADVDVIKVTCGRALAHGGKCGDTVEIGVFARGELDGIAVLRGLFPGLLGKVARDHVAGATGAHEVHGDARKLQRGAAL